MIYGGYNTLRNPIKNYKKNETLTNGKQPKNSRANDYRRRRSPFADALPIEHALKKHIHTLSIFFIFPTIHSLLPTPYHKEYIAQKKHTHRTTPGVAQPSG